MRSHQICDDDREDTTMLSEFEAQTSARHRQATLLTEAADRGLLRTTVRRSEVSAPSGRRLPAFIRRLVGAPTFA
jgi:hypothetical protein